MTAVARCERMQKIRGPGAGIFSDQARFNRPDTATTVPRIHGQSRAETRDHEASIGQLTDGTAYASTASYHLPSLSLNPLVRPGFLTLYMTPTS